MLMGPIPDREEAVEILYKSLMEYVNVGPGACVPCLAVATSGLRSCSSRPGPPEAHNRRAVGASHGAAMSVFA